MNKHDRMMAAAMLSACFNHEKARYHMGCVIVSNGRVMANGHNIYYGVNGKRTIHAEVSACIRAGIRNCRGMVAYVGGFRVRRNGTEAPLCSKPCVDCMAFMKKCGIARAYYREKDGRIESVAV